MAKPKEVTGKETGLKYRNGPSVEKSGLAFKKEVNVVCLTITSPPLRTENKHTRR